MENIEFYNFNDCQTVLIYRKQPWVDWVHVTSAVTRSLKLDNLTPSVFILKTDEQDLKLALKPYWECIFDQQLPFIHNRPELTEELFYEWFDVKPSGVALLDAKLSTI